MKVHKFSRKDLAMFGKVANLLGNHQETLKPLIDLPFSLENFQKQIKKKHSFSEIERNLLVETINNQYHNARIETPKNASALLSDSCFTVCTGHQLNIFTGPLYTIYKIAHTIKLAEQLNDKYSEYSFVPIFWMATEDHDLEEINHFHLGKNKFSWQTKQSGAVGRMKLDSWLDWQNELISIFPNHTAKIKALLYDYRGENLAQATRKLIHFLFQQTPLLILDGDDKALKTRFSPIMRLEIETQFAIKASQISGQILKDKGLKEQAFVREINLFSLENNNRSRIEYTDGQYVVGEKSFSRQEILTQLEHNPENFSPNVILRPLYQETVLPNLCYIGGGGELAYWLQLKPIFEAADIPFPLLQLRFSAHICTEKEWKQMHKFGFDFTEFSKTKDDVLKKSLVRLIQRNIENERLEIQNLVNQLQSLLIHQAQKVDNSLIASAEARIKKIEKQITAFDEKLLRNERKIHRDTLDRIEKLHHSFFSEGIPQERNQNFIYAYLETQGTLIDLILKEIDVFVDEFLIFEI